jgi:hypothetical protein
MELLSDADAFIGYGLAVARRDTMAAGAAVQQNISPSALAS